MWLQNLSDNKSFCVKLILFILCCCNNNVYSVLQIYTLSPAPLSTLTHTHPAGDLVPAAQPRLALHRPHHRGHQVHQQRALRHRETHQTRRESYLLVFSSFDIDANQNSLYLEKASAFSFWKCLTALSYSLWRHGYIINRHKNCLNINVHQC